MRVSMSVAIVAMVRTTNTTTNSSLQTDTDTCPGQEVVTSSTGSKNGEFEWNELTQSYILTGGIYGSLVTVLIGARLAEMFGNKRVCGISMFMSAVLNILSPICVRWNVAAFIAARVLQGFFTGPFMPANMSLFASWVPPQERARLSGIIFSASNIGSLISMGISGKMASTFGWESLFYVYGVLTALWCVLWMFLVHESPETHPWISDEEKEYIVSNTKKVAIAKNPVPWIGIIFNLPFCAQIIMDIGSTWIMFTLTTELPTYLKNILHFDTESASYITALPYLAGWLSNVSSGIISQWLRHKGYVSHMTAYRIFNGIAALGPAVSLIIITQLGCDSVSIIILFTITLLFNGSYFGGSMLGVMDLGVNFAGTMSGISGTITGITGIIAPTIVGAVTNNHVLSKSIGLLIVGVGHLFATYNCRPWSGDPHQVPRHLPQEHVLHAQALNLVLPNTVPVFSEHLPSHMDFATLVGLVYRVPRDFPRLPQPIFFPDVPEDRIGQISLWHPHRMVPRRQSFKRPIDVVSYELRTAIDF
uniref:(California timema) hypothetical protein n=1 Tax=Timema californicum TaxID=61474 RepID=A0A7R9JF94_TIMCA|nr:unnamed protein product [Timema californicum]